MRGPPSVPAELMPVELLLGLHEEVGGVEGVVAQELEEPAVELAAAGLGGGVEHAPRLAELGGVGALLDLELLQGVDRGLDVRPALVVVGHVHAVDLEGELAAAHAADRGAGDEVGADADQVAAAGEAGRARSEAGQLVEAAPVEGQVRDLGVRDVLAERSRLGVEEGRGGGDLGGLVARAQLELDVHAHRLPDRDLDAGHHGRLEALAHDVTSYRPGSTGVTT
jgi:hypothetical protein